MKKGMTKLIALVLALLMVLGTSALAAETKSDPYQVRGAQERPEETPAPEEPDEPAEPGSSEPTEPADPTEPAEPAQPEQVIGQKQVVLNDPDASVKVFADPDAESAVVANAFHGDVVDVLRVDGGWTKVRIGGAEGYIASAHLKEVGSAAPVEPVEPEASAEPSEQPVEPEASAEPEQPVEPEATAEPEQPVAHDEPIEQPAAPSAPAFEYERGEDGSLLLDENGNPVPVLPEDAQIKPVAFQRDADGNLILDENGNPIPVQFLPVEAEKIDTIQDALDPNRSIDVYAAWDSEHPTSGDTMRLYAVLNGYDNLVYTLQWQDSVDGETWSNIEGATGNVCAVVVTDENYLYYWRVEVTITDVKGAA